MLKDAEIRVKMIEALQSIAPDTMGVGQLDDDLNLQDKFDLDSVDLVRYLAKLEEVFGISLAGLNYRSFLTIRDGMGLLRSKFDRP
jgi:acyl carrier protein